VNGRLLTVAEAANDLGRSQEFVRGLIRRGRIVSMRINGRWYIPAWSLDELLRPKAPAAPAFAREIKPRRGGRAGQSGAGSAPVGGERNAA
jgi:excisionase family DNA binding protein